MVTVLVLAPAPFLAPVPMLKVQEVGQPCLKAGMKEPEFSHQVPGERAFVWPQIFKGMTFHHLLVSLILSSLMRMTANLEDSRKNKLIICQLDVLMKMMHRRHVVFVLENIRKATKFVSYLAPMSTTSTASTTGYWRIPPVPFVAGLSYLLGTEKVFCNENRTLEAV